MARRGSARSPACATAGHGEGSVGLGVAAARPGLPGDSGERPQARRVPPGWAVPRRVGAAPCPPSRLGKGQRRGVTGRCCRALPLRVVP